MVKRTGRKLINGKRIIWLVGFIFLLIAGVLLVGCNWLGFGKKASAPAPAAPSAAAKAPAKAAEAKAPETAPPAAETFAYSSGGKRDPFVALIIARGPGEKIKGDAKRSLEVGDLKLVGIVWDKRGYYYALVETPQGLGYTLRKNDQIGLSTVVSKITKDSVHFLTKTRAYAGAKGEASEVVLKLRKED